MTPSGLTLPEALMILAESAEVGGEEGLLGGPVGAVVGVGVGLVAGLILFAVKQAENEYSDSKPGSVEQCPYKAAEAADEEIECFEPREDRPDQDKVFKTMDREDYERSVKMAEAEINKLSPDQFLDRLKKLEKGAWAIRNEPENLVAYEKAKEEWERIFKEEMPKAMPHLAQVLLKEKPKYPLSAEEARASVEREMDKSRLDLMHSADIGGGGDPKKFAGLGDSSINRSLGPQWRARLAALKKKAENAKKEGKQKMNVELKVCPEEAT